MNRLPQKDLLYLSIMIVAAILLRLPLVPSGITIDDAFSAYIVEASSWADLFERIRTLEMSPPLYFLVLKSVVQIFGLNTPALTLASMVFSVVTVPFVYLLGRSCPSDEQIASKVGLCAAFFATTSGLAILYSHEARTYALAGMLVTLSLLLYMPFFEGRSNRKRQAALFITTALLAYTHYTAIPYIGIMTLIAFIYRKSEKSLSLEAVPPMVAGLATLIPWYPVLKYQTSFGTPWADPISLSQFPKVLASNLSATSPLPVVQTYVFLTLAMPIIIGLYIVIKPRDCLAQIASLSRKPKILTLTVLLFYSASVFGYLTPYMFGYVRYMCPIAATAWVLLAIVVVRLAELANQVKPIKTLIRPLKICSVSLAALTIVTFSVQEVLAMAQNRSGLRRLARDIVANHFAKAAFITSPDFVGIILGYYLKHECAIKPANLPNIIGFACPERGLFPPTHANRTDCWRDPQLMSKWEGYLKKIEQTGAFQVVMVRDTYTATSKAMPVNEMTNKLEALLRTKLVPLGPTETYGGWGSTYLVTRYAFPNQEGRH